MPTTRPAPRSASCRATPAGPEATSRTSARAVGDDVVDHGPAPPTVLAHREHLGQAVVACGQWGEQLLGEPVGIASTPRRSTVPPRVPRSHRRRSSARGACVTETLRRARGGRRPGREHRRPGAGPSRRHGGAGGQGPVPEGQGLRRLHRSPRAPGARRPRAARAPRTRRGRHGGAWVRPGGGWCCPASTGRPTRGRARAVTRAVFDDALRTAALDAGAVAVQGRAGDPLGADGGIGRVRRGAGADDPRRLRHRGRRGHQPRGQAGRTGGARPASCGASRSAATCRTGVDLPAITLWEQTPWRAFPGYGWIFPGPDGGANVGTRDRHPGRPPGGRRKRCGSLPAYLDYLADLGLLDRAARTAATAASGDGSRWGWSGPFRPPAGCCWSGTRPDWSTPSRGRGSPRP